ncbi:RHS repeat domain-containing protein [Chryseobacterium sp. P1-3]|uniref:RHS repeat domain-containing protein n=1 Tax=Chryseobacterium sp. (strain P1-3) TaxID=1517683 RepID=UPI001EE671DC|nr:RHS repeat-associated core domain-containing protein [Chryseobacterium sp. P1-3]
MYTTSKEESPKNDQVGTIKFENSQKIYQPTGMTLNAAGVQNYNNDLIQSISYNENNDPVFIDGEKGDAAFQYGLTPMRQRVTYGGNFSSDGEGKFTKYYSEDGSYEIVKDNTTGKEKHIIYIGGTPYESNIVYLKNYVESSGSYKFLHKDYIGSILAISDEAGNKLEQRHFDAWGNMTHLQIGNGLITTDINKIKETVNKGGLLLERGYTSHEHFMEVGIIHMNGRLYDPLLRRFLNADENIQDPYNTQNYNKYGYVMNNPLMFNDPSGEFFVAGFFLSYIAPIIWGAIVGTAIAGTAYLLTAAFTQNFTWSGFGKALLMGAVGGAVTGLLNPGLFLCRWILIFGAVCRRSDFQYYACVEHQYRKLQFWAFTKYCLWQGGGLWGQCQRHFPGRRLCYIGGFWDHELRSSCRKWRKRMGV